mmetsp:Transcript_19134/g.38698  ORF Transcript_19134/g.38698 Transcript_19134/m.38698 type:complete len:202 (+) Transcript_19134:107-712(+)
MKILFLTVVSFFPCVASWIVTPVRHHHLHHHLQATRTTTTTRLYSTLSADDVDTDAILTNLKALLEHLDGPDGGKKLYAASSPSWQAAIQAAVGAPETADVSLVTDALQQAMARPKNQFAILMGAAEPFEAVFPSDPVVNDATSVWVECQLREANGPELLVDMAISLKLCDGGWKIDELQWQDFRDAYYPGLSGREWLRAF